MADAKKLNKEQVEAIVHGSGPLLIIAGAGTGKTTVVTERIKHLILKKNIPASSILALTFTEKAAAEMEERVDVAMPYGYTQMWISTFHSFCDRILRNEAIHIGLNPAYSLASEAETILFLRKNLYKFDLNYFRPLGNPYKFLSSILQHFSRLKDEDVSPNEYLSWTQAKDSQSKADEDEFKKNLELAYAYKTYEELKATEGIMDYADLISNTLALFRTRKNLLKNYQEQFRYILVDEFQDTNFAQNLLAILLAGDQKNITVVGDDDQAIYRWRGAAISNMIQFRKTFKDAKIVTLTKNYRSTKEILDASYAVIQNNNPDRLEVKERINKKLVSVRNIKGKPIELIYEDRVENEAESVTKEIAKLIEGKKYTYKDVAILVRANDHSQPFVRSLERANIPFQFLGPGQLFHQEEIKDLIAYLRVLYNFDDAVSLYRILTMKIFNLDPKEISSLLNAAKRKNLSLFRVIEKVALKSPETDGLFLSEQTFKAITLLYEMIERHLAKIPKETAGQIVYFFLKDSGLLEKMLERSFEETKESQNIARFFDKLKTFEANNADASVFAVVEWIDLAMQLGESPLATDTDWTETNAVNILTIHSSKGLEFPVVFLANLVSLRFPTRERKEPLPIPTEFIKEILPVGDYHLEEERRLFYVAMTRAKDLLFITAAKYYAEGKRERKLSPFVYETFGEKYVNSLLKKGESGTTMFQQSLLEWDASPPFRPDNSKKPSPITYLSYSQIQTFDMCPLHYKLRYMLKLPAFLSSSLSFGTSVHNTLRDFYLAFSGGEKISVQEVPTLVEKNWIDEGYNSKQHQDLSKKTAIHIITLYLEKNFDPKKITPQDVRVETPFLFSIKNPSNPVLTIKLGGRIDRIDLLDKNKIEIIDYKTGRNVPKDSELQKDPQLTFYALAATEMRDQVFNKKPEDILLSLYYLEEDKKLTTTRTKEQLDAAKEWVFQKAEEIQKSDFACSHAAICENCEYKMLCLV